MERCPNSFSTLGQLYPECISNNRSGIWHLFNRSVHRTEEVICPKPRHLSRTHFVTDSLNRFCCKPKSILPMHGEDSGLEILGIILNKDEPEEEDLDESSQMGFFCGSPPVRTSNPVIHDAQFAYQTITVVSPLGNYEGEKPSARVERGASLCGSSFGEGKPMVRIEGFASGNSKSQCVVRALA